MQDEEPPGQDELFGLPPALFGTDPHKLHRTDAPSTSVAAAHSVNTTKSEAFVYEIVESFGPAGCILDEVLAVAFEKQGFAARVVNTVTARFKALEEKGLIYYTGETRPGESGRQSRVRVATKFRVKPEGSG